MIKLLEKLQKVSERDYIGQISFSELKEMINNNMLNISKGIDVDNEALQGIEKLILNGSYITQVKLGVKDNEIKVIEGNHNLLAIRNIADIRPNELAHITVIKCR